MYWSQIPLQPADFKIQAALNASRKELAEKKVFEPDSSASAVEKARYQEKLIATDSYKATQKQWGTGSAIQQGIQAATAAVQGLAAGDIKAAIAGGAAPYLAKVIHKMTTDENGNVNKPANLMAHAVVNAALAAAHGTNVLVGAGGAATAEMVGMIATSAYGKPVSELSETEKQTVSALATLAAGLSGGLIGDSSADMVTAAQVGKTTVENNALAVPAPVPVPGVPAGPGDKVKQEADKNIASGLQGAINDAADWLDKATDCSFGRACSSDNPGQESKPNVAGSMTDREKAELGGAGSGMPGGWGPEDEQNARDKNLSSSDQRSIKSLEEQIRVHEEKLEAYKKNPDSFDNKGHLQNAPNDAVRQRIIDGRNKHLEQEIRTFQKNINEIRAGKG